MSLIRCQLFIYIKPRFIKPAHYYLPYLKIWGASYLGCCHAIQFDQNNYVQEVISTIKQSGANPKLLKLEITESILFENIIEKMAELKKIGVSFSLDDFGTGYSSLQYLKQLPLDQLKIDQSFVRDIEFDEQDRSIVQTIIAMASGLGLDVIAEGVETVEQQNMLLEFGCANFQGYLFAKPMSVDKLEGQLK